MNNNNIFDIKENNWKIKISTWISWRYWDVNISLNYKELDNLLLKEFWLNILEFIEESRTKWSFIIDKYNKNLPKQHNRWVHLIKENLLIQKVYI
jgi:hypothetical protein